MSNSTYQVCSVCVMDTSDPDIKFDDDGTCSHCRAFNARASREWFPNEDGAKLLVEKVEEIKRAGKGREYDCILGLSGGVDSSYLALKVKEWQLRPLVVHVDAGWNSELAVANIESLVRHCGYDLHTHVVDWEDMRNLHEAYLKSGISNQDVPQDHIFFASLYHFAVLNKIKFILSGGNLATEGVFPSAWHGSAMDALNLKAIYSEYGRAPLRQYRTISFSQLYFIYPLIYRLRTVRPLNYIPYVKRAALEELVSKVGYKPYPRKHGESVFTKLFQNYYFPARFGYDKRRPHLSSLIVSGQMTRDQALRELANPLYDEAELEVDIAYFCKKIRIERAEFDRLLTAPLRHYSEFRNWDSRYATFKRLQSVVSRVLGRDLKVYS